MKVGQEGPMYTHNDFRTYVSVLMCMAAIILKIASMLDLISQATYIRFEKFNKQTDNCQIYIRI